MHYACVTHVLGLCYACVTLGLHLRYAWVKLGLRLCYTCVTLVLRLHYACEFNINIKLSCQLSVCDQSDVSLSSLCRLSSIGQHALRMCYACVWLELLLCFACISLALRLHYTCEFNINIKLSRQLSVCHHSVVCLQ